VSEAPPYWWLWKPARPKIMAMTNDKQLAYGYFSQTLLPDYIEEKGVNWNVVYDARGHFEEPHTNISVGCGTIGVRDYLRRIGYPTVIEPAFKPSHVTTLGPRGNIAAVLFCEKEGFNPLFKSVDLANRWDLMIISTKGVSVTAARQLIERICGGNSIPLFVLHDFDVAGFMILGTLSRDTRRYRFSSVVNPISLGLRLDDIDGLESEPAAFTKTDNDQLAAQLRENGATKEEIEILLDERVELNALTSDALIEMIETKLKARGLQKVDPSAKLLADAYVAFHKSRKLRNAFDELKKDMSDEDVEVPEDLEDRVRKILADHPHLRWDDAVRLTFDKSKLEEIEAEKKKNKEEAGDFSEFWDDHDDDDEEGEDDDEE
jgi:hypothetical protein